MQKIAIQGITTSFHDVAAKKYFGNDFFPLTNLSRVYRNFIHPGVELKNSLDKTKSDLCFISSIEILRKIL